MTTFPDVEIALRTALVAALAATPGALAANVTVATIKPEPTVKPYPAKLVVIRSDGGSSVERGLTKREMVGVNVYATNYADASNLARLVESLMRGIASGSIKLVETLMFPVRVDTESTSGPQQRYMTFEVVVQAS
jgi:hypothetical protein